jgi:hypothetical protein
MAQLERFFAQITSRRIRRDPSRSVADLRQAIEDYLATIMLLVKLACTCAAHRVPDISPQTLVEMDGPLGAIMLKARSNHGIGKEALSATTAKQSPCGRI